jgi:hypothetical protein
MMSAVEDEALPAFVDVAVVAKVCDFFLCKGEPGGRMVDGFSAVFEIDDLGWEVLRPVGANGFGRVTLLA